jgi:flavin-dependent dehydrogenase
VTTTGHVDVVVIGGGPAGAVTALLLARAGAAVVLFEQSRYDALRFGETLPPSVNPLLRELGLWERFRVLRSVPSYQTASVWGAAEPAERSFVFSPHGHGWHVDRARFDHMLTEAAEDAGARVQRGIRVRKVSRTGDRLLVEAAKPIRVGAVVDATGRAARIAKALGAIRDQLDRLVCAAVVFAVGTQQVGDTFIEAAPNGWWYASPLPEGRRLIAFFTDARYAARARLATADGWVAALVQTDHVRHLAPSRPDGKVHVVTCASHELRPSTGRDWIAVGDAALAVDPLSSNGVTFALGCATAAADVLLGGDRLAYQGLIATEARQYRQMRTQIYGWEDRFADNDFWRTRGHLTKPKSEVELKK